MVALFFEQPELYLASDPYTWIQLAILLATVALAVTQKKPKSAPLDDHLQSSATRGSYIPLLVGRHRVGPIFGFVGDATDNSNFDSLSPGSQPGFGKGSGGVPNPGSYFEDGLHFLCVGPASKLEAIYQNGEAIWRGPISPSTHPSGSEFTIPDQGIFRVYWGFKDDPVLPATVSSAPEFDLQVNFALTMKIVWMPKNLGQSRTWPRLEYEVECPCYSQISSSSSELPIEGDESLPTWESAGFDPPLDAVLGNLPGDKIQLGIHKFADIGGGSYAAMVLPKRGNSGYMPQAKRLLEQFPQGTVVKLAVYSTSALGDSTETIPYGSRVSPAAAGVPTALVWHYFWIKSSRIQQTQIFAPSLAAAEYLDEVVLELGPLITGNYVYNQVALVPSVPSIGYSSHPIQNLGLVEPIDCRGTDGVNPIHIVDQLLFAKRPYGAGKDRSKFDPRSIEEAAVVMQSEKIRGSIAVKDGEGVESVLATIMQDCGFFISWDPQTGLFVFKMLRYDDPLVVANLPKEMILKRPEMTSVRGTTPADVLAFTFKDRRRNYREEPLMVQDDGQVSLYESVKAKKIPIEITTDQESAARMVPRRQQEVLANQSLISFETNHAAQMAVAGNRISATDTEGVGFLFRISSVKRDINSSKVVLDCLLDNYDPPPSSEESFSFLDQPSQGGMSRKSAEASQAYAIAAIETPRALSGGNLSVFFPAGRVSVRTSGAAVWGSRDGSSYSVLGVVNLVILGTLEVDLPADGPAYDESLYGVSPISVDFDSIEDLTIDEGAWRAGRQLLLIGDEVCFLRSTSGDKLDGLIRGRVGTRQVTHPAGTPFAVVLAHRATTLQSAMFVPGKTVSFKVQALEGSKTSSIDDIDPLDITIAGKVYTPLPPSSIRQSSLRPDYSVSDDIEIVWNWVSDRFARTGMGSQACGAATGISPPQGHFVFRIYDNTDTLLAEGVLTEPLLIMDAADRAPLGLDSLPHWTLEVQAVEGSFSSASASSTFYPV